MRYGYMRVSTVYEESKSKNQNFDRQLMILKENGISEENIFQERISGGVSTKKRPEFDRMMSLIKSGDTIVVSEMSRFSRSLQDLIETVNLLSNNNIGIVFIKENISIDSNGLNPMNKLIFQLFGAFAEFEKSLIAERVKMGLKAAKEKGTKLGRRFKIDEIDTEDFTEDYLSGKKYDDMSKKYNITKHTIISIAKKLGLPPRNQQYSNNRPTKNQQ